MTSDKKGMYCMFVLKLYIPLTVGPLLSLDYNMIYDIYFGKICSVLDKKIF